MSALDEALFNITGSDENTFFALMRQEIDPWLAVAEVLADVNDSGLLDQADYDSFVEACNNFLARLDAANSSDDRTVTGLDRYWHERDPEPMFDNYNPRQFQRDIAGLDQPSFVEPKSSPSRQVWKRTVGKESELYCLSEWGHFSFDVTQKYTQSLLRVRTHILMGEPTLGVGAVQINLRTGVCTCYVSGCGWKRGLRYAPVDALSDDFDREYAEFQVLSILAHLGEHTKRNSKNYWNPILSVPRYRDTDTLKKATRARALGWQATRALSAQKFQMIHKERKS